jgi:hypothetical protein
VKRARILLIFLTAPFAVPFLFGADAKIAIDSPQELKVFQRRNERSECEVKVHGTVQGDCLAVQFRVSGKSTAGELEGKWQTAVFDGGTKEFTAFVMLPPGGWYRLEVQASNKSTETGRAEIEHFGVGEVFVIAGQSNSTNYGAEKQKPASGMVSTFDGKTWRIADDPQPGVQDGSKGGSFIPAFGDALYEKYKVPIGVACTGAGATSVRQWLPKGEKVEPLPTLTAHVKVTGANVGESTGELFDGLVKRMAALRTAAPFAAKGTGGFRAVLWHQGESDAGQARAGYPVERQISAESYRALLEKVIRASQESVGRQVTWFVAQTTFHSSKDPSDAEFRAAQKALWDSGVAREGPDTDALVGDLRAGVHFSAKGQQAHGKAWAAKVSDWLDRILKLPTTVE